MAQVDTNFPKVRRMLFYVYPLTLGYFWPSLPESDPQILEHWDYANEDHLGKSFQAKNFGFEC